MKGNMTIVTVTVLVLAAVTFAGTYSGGSGTSEDAYRIATAEDLIELGKTPADLGKSFVLTADLDMSAYSGTQFKVIGHFPQTKGFSGIFNGNGHVIRNLTYTKENYSTSDMFRTGLFGRLDDKGEVHNLGVENLAISCREVLCLGGLVGENLGRISGCHTTGSVSGIADSIGGLVGADFGLISDSYSACTVSGNKEVGGFAGYLQFSLNRCFATGSVTGTGTKSTVGGLVGRNGGTVSRCYATGGVNSIRYAGGLIGRNEGSLTHCFAAGSVGSDGYAVGGLAGETTTRPISGCFWDVTVSGLTDGIGNKNPDPSGVTGIDTVGMMTRQTFLTADWDFVGELANGTEDVWRICADGVSYPRLSWEFSDSGDFDCPNGVALEDLLYLAQRWMATTPAATGAADFNGDGKVSLEDFAVLAVNWMK